MPTVTVNDVELYYERRGSGAPLLLIQGMSGNTVHWGEDFLGDLAASFDVIAYDHRGIGQSAPYWEPFTIRELAADALALLDALEIDRAHVCGISMGGMVAQELVLAAPERVATLTLGCTFCGGPEATFADQDDLRGLAEALGSGNRERALRAMYEINVSPAYADAPGHFERFLEMAVVNPAPARFIQLQAQAIAGHDTSDRLPDVSAPTLVVHGEVDRLLPAANGRLIARLIPGAAHVALPGVGHAFWWERPAEAAALIREHAASAAAAAQ